jgi:hypothetical protein
VRLNIVRGTDAIWGSSPQSLIEGFVAFRMDPAISERHGYPELTDAIKAKILGLNTARIYAVDAEEQPCQLADEAFARLRSDVRLARRVASQPLHPLQISQRPRTRR